MPLSARTQDGERVYAPLLSDQQWHELVREVRGGALQLQTRCCGQPARPRVSTRGTRHFFHHRPSQPCSAPAGETPEHLRLKDLVARALAAHDLPVELEVEGDGWRADVLAAVRGKRVAFEIQLSAQDATTTLERMARHAAADVVSIWLMKRRPPTLDAGLPCFPLRLGDEPAVVLPAAWLPASDWPTLPVGAFLDALVDQRLAYRRAPTGLARAELAAIATTCWHCEAPYTAYDRQVSLVCRCGRDLGAPTTRYADQLWRVLAVQAARRALPVRDGHPPATIQQRVLSVRPVGLPEDLASLVARHSRPEPQWVNVCPRCRRTLGPFYLARLPVDEWIDMNLPPELAWGHADGSSGHWCLAPPSGRDG